ncbi:MAG: M56 family metallopeptidase [candidate division Zixibacteria bacterium]|nr:M56 family metallopeptidase [candidate division Zixibacteria bacterium]
MSWALDALASFQVNQGFALLIFANAIKGALIAGLSLFVLRVALRRTSPVIHLLIMRWTVGVLLLLPVVALTVDAWILPVSDSVASVLRINSSTVGLNLGHESESSQGILSLAALSTMALILWLAGVVVVIVRRAIGVLRANAICRSAETIASGQAVEITATVTSRIRLKQPVRLASSQRIDTPFVWGIFRPTIVLPRSAQDWSAERLRMVLSHELAHIKGRDIFWNFIALGAEAIHWFNPLVWMLRKSMNEETEIARDDSVLRVTADAQTYAEHLVAMAREITNGHPAVPAAVGMANRIQLEARIMSIMNNRVRSVEIGRSLTALISLCAFLMILPLAMLQLHAENKADTTKTELPRPDDFVAMDSVPVAVLLPNPVYPKDAKKANQEGTIRLKVLIDKEGTVRDVIMLKPSGHKTMDDAALEAAGKGKWLPAKKEGKPVAVWVSYEIKFGPWWPHQPAPKEP